MRPTIIGKTGTDLFSLIYFLLKDKKFNKEDN